VITSLAPYLEKNTAVPLPIPELEPKIKNNAKIIYNYTS
jgi:hypothetical protein